MSGESGSPRGPNERSPHPATVVQPKAPHVATVRRAGQGPNGQAPHPATVVQPKAPHVATVGRAGQGPNGQAPHSATVVQPRTPPPAKAWQGRKLPPHPATVAQPKPALGGRAELPPHPATVVQRKLTSGASGGSADVVQRTWTRTSNRNVRTKIPFDMQDVVLAGHGEFRQNDGMATVPDSTIRYRVYRAGLRH
jgi:hypothetical protein